MNPRHSSRPDYVLLAVFALSFILVGVDRSGWTQVLRPLTTRLYAWVLLLSAFALLLGVLSVVWLHIRRIQLGREEWWLSLILLVALLAVVGAGLVDASGAFSPPVMWMFDYVIAPIQATLFALLAFFLAAAAYRFLRIGRSGGVWMLAGALFMLIVQAPVSRLFLAAPLERLADWLLEQPVMAALRGVILGGGLALLVIGVRFLLDRET